MGSFLLWYLTILLVGWLVFPAAHSILSFLPGRGYALSKALGLLVWAFLYWLLGSFHLLQADWGGACIALILTTDLSLAVTRGRWRDAWTWMRENRRLVITSEVLFLVAFAAWAVVRAASPEAAGTEKPMEQAFINAILYSGQMPPPDPWLSGYSISYYYFGYVMVALLSRFSGLAGEVGFNLGLASWFGLAAVGAYGVLYDLLALRPAHRNSPSNISWALLAPLFLLLISNANGPLELLHASGAFWQRGADGAQTSSFWTWLDIQELNNPPAEPYRLEPNRPGGIWWWRSSRVLTDYDMNGASREVIDEFPAFSFVLGDLHPHVLSIPFNLLAVGLALNLFLRVRAQKQKVYWASGWVSQFSFWLAALALGGLAFLNTWDFPIYFGLYLGAFGLARLRCLGWRMQVVWEMLRLGILLGLAGILFYIPFYAGFSSQAGGLLPSLAFFTRGIHFWIMFLPLLLPILLWLIGGDVFTNRRSRLWRGLGIAAGLLAGLTALSYLFGWLMYLRPDSAAVIYNIQGGVESGMALLGSLAKRMAQPGMWMTLLGLLALVFAWVLREPGADAEHEDFSVEEGGLSAGLAQPQEKEDVVPVNGFILLLVMGGAALVLVPEFFYLRDQFGWRMNTIFKFYYQAWILWGLAAGFASVWLWQEWRSRLAVPVRIVWVPLIALCLVYLTYGVMDRTNKFNPEAWSFNSANLVQRYQPDDYDAIQWMKSAPGGGAVAEAVGGSYSEFARVATFSGKPNVIGWPGHISQWRGGMAEAGSREQDLETLYTTRDWSVAQEIIARYQIHYVYVGNLERTKYNLREEKFLGNMRVVYQNNSVTIYEAPVSLYTTR